VDPLQGTLGACDEPGLAPATFDRVALDDSTWVDVARGWLRGADTLLDRLIREVPWRQGRREMYDRIVDEPRLSRWYGSDRTPPDPVLEVARTVLVERYRRPLGGPGLNYYRTGRDSVAWHRDRELRRLDDTLVAILTLGATRPFLVRPVGGGASIDLRPGSGDLLVLGGRAQADWEHSVPKVVLAGPRISVSWRWASPRGTPVARSRTRRGDRPARARHRPTSSA
jgi:alkylated DNA repair dioxygenase AlkB